MIDRIFNSSAAKGRERPILRILLIRSKQRSWLGGRSLRDSSPNPIAVQQLVWTMGDDSAKLRDLI